LRGFFRFIFLISVQIVERTVGVLDKLDQWVTEIPPDKQETRFGNKAFRVWLARVNEVLLPSLKLLT
jgi:hypothetical protein